MCFIKALLFDHWLEGKKELRLMVMCYNSSHNEGRGSTTGWGTLRRSCWTILGIGLKVQCLTHKVNMINANK